MRDESQAGTFSEADLDRYRQALSSEGALTAMVNWYRALFRHSEDPPRERVDVPTIVVWGENDQALVPEMASASVDYCDNGRLERFADATHWVPHEYPDQVCDLLLEHLES